MKRAPTVAYAVGWGVLLVILAVGMEFLPSFGASRQALRDGLGPEGGPGGRSVRLLQQLGLPSGSTVWTQRASDAPSSRAAEQFLEPDHWLVSVAIPEESLHDPERGILANPDGRGRDWEQVGWVSVYEGRRLVVATRIGLRVHGSSGRGAGREAFRVIFRPSYGLPQLPSGGPLETARRPPDRFVVRQSQVMPQAQPIAFELSRRIGAIAPSAVSVRFVLNGSLRPDVYELTEHVSRQGWGRAFFEHDDFRFYHFRGPRLPADEIAYRTLREWVTMAPAPLLMEQVADRVDLANLVRHIFTFMYCGTMDWAQGAAVMDLRSASPRWFWVHWDLDQSFTGTEPEPWARPSVGLLTAPLRPEERSDVRAVLFQRLIREDRQFVGYFSEFVATTLNHSLTGEYLRDLIRRHERQSIHAVAFGGVDLTSFFDHRGDEVFDAVAEAIGEPRPHTVQVQAPDGVRLQIDGYESASPYRGRYFDRQVVTIRLFGDGRESAILWSVNGREQRADTLRISVDGDTLVRVEN